MLHSRPGLAHKQYTGLERLARIKHSSLLWKFVNYDRKKFYNIGPRLFFARRSPQRRLSRRWISTALSRHFRRKWKSSRKSSNHFRWRHHLSWCQSHKAFFPLSLTKRPNQLKRKLKLTRWNLGRVFHSRLGCACIGHAIVHMTKQPNVKLKTPPEQILGSLPFAFALPGMSMDKLWPKVQNLGRVFKFRSSWFYVVYSCCY